MRGSTLAVAAVAAAFLSLLAVPAHAYLDPGTGSYVFQMVAAALVSVGFVARAYWHRLRGLFTRRGPSPPPGPPAPPDER
jgi:hypothetical protein